jgi:hypothetical protein
MAKVIIDELFEDNGTAHKRNGASYWELAYFWGQTALFDDLEPDTWEDIFWASVNAEHPKMYPLYDWPDEEARLRFKPSHTQLALLKGDEK